MGVTYNKNTTILDPRVTNGTFKVMVVSDGHKLNHQFGLGKAVDSFFDWKQKRFLYKVARKANLRHIDYFLWAGDYANYYNYLEDEKNAKLTIEFARKIGVPFLFGKGNHDSFEKGTTKEEPWIDRINEYCEILKFFMKREHTDNIFLLDSKGVAFDKHNVVFYEIPKGSFKLYEPEHENKEASIRAFNEAIRSVNTNPNRCNIAEFHTPIWTVKNGKYLAASDIPSYGDFVAFICGHMHDGAAGILKHVLPNNGGIVGPQTIISPKHLDTFFPTDCRGEYCERAVATTVDQIMEALIKIETPEDLIKTLTLFARSKKDLQLISDIAKSPNLLAETYTFILEHAHDEVLPLLLISEGLKTFPEFSIIWGLANMVYTHHTHTLTFEHISQEQIDHLKTINCINPGNLTKEEKQTVKRFGTIM